VDYHWCDHVIEPFFDKKKREKESLQEKRSINFQLYKCIRFWRFCTNEISQGVIPRLFDLNGIYKKYMKIKEVIKTILKAVAGLGQQILGIGMKGIQVVYDIVK